MNPLFSAALLLGILGLWTAGSLAELSLPAIASNLALLGLLGGGAIAAYNWQAASSGRPPLPVSLSLPIAPRDVEQAFASIGSAAGGAIASLNFLLSWREPVASLRALAYAWLLSRFAFLLSPGWLVTRESQSTASLESQAGLPLSTRPAACRFASLRGPCPSSSAASLILRMPPLLRPSLPPSLPVAVSLLAFLAAPAYLLNAPVIDSLYTTQLLPKANAAAAAVRTQRDALLALVAGPSAQVYAIVGIVGATVLGYMAWDWFTFTGIATLLTLLLAAHDALMAVATGNAVAAGSATSAARRAE